MSKTMESQKIAEQYKEQMVGKKYRHFKGGMYFVTDIAVHTETEDVMVVYKDCVNPSLVWTRPLKVFFSEVDKSKYPNAIQERKFKKLLNPDKSEQEDTGKSNSKIYTEEDVLY